MDYDWTDIDPDLIDGIELATILNNQAAALFENLPWRFVDADALRDRDASEFTIVFVDDKFFKLDPADTTSADNGITVIVDDGGNRWKSGGSGVAASSYDIGTGGDYANVQAAIDAVSLLTIPSGATVTFNVAAEKITTTTGNIANIPPTLGQQLKIVGATPASKTISSVQAVTGSAGAYSVQYNLNNVTGISIGDYLRISNVVPINNGLIWGFSDLSLGYAGWSGTTVSFGFAPAGIVAVGDHLHINGQSTVVTAVSSSPSLTVTVTDSADPVTPVVQAYWYLTKKKTGTIGTSGLSTTVTGSGSPAFLSVANVGDLLIVYGMFCRITAVSNNTTLSVSHGINISAGAPFSIVPNHTLHEGCWVVTGVDGGNNRVTVTNTNQMGSGFAPPPKNGISGGTVEVMKSVLEQTGAGNGIMCLAGAKLDLLDNIVIAGTGTGNIGLNLQDTDLNGSGHIRCGPTVGVNGWLIGMQAGGGCSFWGDYICISNCERGTYTFDGAFSALKYSCVTGNETYGNFASQGQIEGDGAHMAGNGFHGLYLGSDSSFHGDIAQWNANGFGIFCEGGSYIHSAPGRVWCHTDLAVFCGKGSSHRLTGMQLFGNDGGAAYNNDTGEGEFATAWVSGNDGVGCLLTNARCSIEFTSFTNNELRAIVATTISQCRADNVNAFFNLGGGLQSLSDSVISADSAYSDANTTDDYSVASGGFISCTNRLGSPTDNQTANVFASGHSLIRTSLFAG
jgi:hypothetical protein